MRSYENRADNLVNLMVGVIRLVRVLRVSEAMRKS